MNSAARPHAESDRSITALSQIRERWLANMLHDISNPLFAARGYVRLALEQMDGLVPDTQRRYLTSALENLNNLVLLTHEFETFRKIDELECSIVRLDGLVRRALQDLQTKLAQRNVAVTVEISQPLSATGDAPKLSEAVRELLSAAVEFTESGGSLHVRASEENGNTLLELLISNASGGSPKESSPHLSTACRIWRLHGGACSFGPDPQGFYRVACELPVIRL